MKLFQKNEPLSFLTHLVAALLSVVALTLMITFALRQGSATQVVGSVIFGVSLILLYSTSTLYHLFPKDTKVKNIFQRLDHAMIYALIAGTYTPICLIMPQHGWGWSILGVIWAIAAVGIVFKSLGKKMTGWLSVVIYIVMGLLISVAISPLRQWLGLDAIKWLLLGGAFYIAGCIFFGLDKFVPRTKWFGMHEAFHLFVIAGSFCHFWLMIKFVL
ncbi:hemolysin III family protein [Patescibacteria group bacterium]|nr:hemolysin III family protein [Patescibacteria group bacterium]